MPRMFVWWNSTEWSSVTPPAFLAASSEASPERREVEDARRAGPHPSCRPSCQGPDVVAVDSVREPACPCRSSHPGSRKPPQPMDKVITPPAAILTSSSSSTSEPPGGCFWYCRLSLGCSTGRHYLRGLEVVRGSPRRGPEYNPNGWTSLQKGNPLLRTSRKGSLDSIEPARY